jgi:hypothetical protein
MRRPLRSGEKVMLASLAIWVLIGGTIGAIYAHCRIGWQAGRTVREISRIPAGDEEGRFARGQARGYILGLYFGGLLMGAIRGALLAGAGWGVFRIGAALF